MLPIAALLVSGFAHHATRYLPARAGFPRRVAFPTPTVVADGQASTAVVANGVRLDHHMMDTTAGAASTRAGSVIMNAEDTIDGLLASLRERPSGARYLLSANIEREWVGKPAAVGWYGSGSGSGGIQRRGTLIVTLPPAGITAVYGEQPRYFWFTGSSIFFLSLLGPHLDFGPPWTHWGSIACWLVLVLSVCCTRIAVLAWTTSTLSIGEFQWQYKETVLGGEETVLGGVVVPWEYKEQGTRSTEKLDVSTEARKLAHSPNTEKQIVLIDGVKKVYLGGESGRVSQEEFDWVFDSVKRQIAAINKGSGAINGK